MKLFWEGKTDDPNYMLTTDWCALDGYHAPGRYPVHGFGNVAPHEHALDAVESPRNNSWFLCALGARRALPWFYWSGETDMNCISQVVAETRAHAYAHHIQRLMVTGNFAMLAGINPDEVDRWYLGIYIDAVEWVELPNTRGMSQYADGGLLASKPYAASANYLNKMGDPWAMCT